MPVDWTEATWRAVYRATIGDLEVGTDWRPCTIVDGVVQATAHGLVADQYVMFRNVQATTPVGDPAEMATYRVGPAPPADSFSVVANAPGFPTMGFPDQACEYSPTRLGEVVTYGRDYYNQVGSPFPQRWSNLVRDLGIVPADRVLVAGCGFGFLIEAAHDAGFANVWGVDSSPFVETRQGTETRGDVTLVADDIRGGGRVRAALRQATGDDEFAWVISEDVLTSYDPATEPTEIDGLLNAAETVLAPGVDASHCVHMVSIPVRPPFTNLTLSEWVAVRPTHTWIRLNLSGWTVILGTDGL